MSLAEHVSLTITQDTIRARRAGFGVPMVLSYHTENADRIRYYTDYASVLADGHDAGSPEGLSAEALFSQTPSPTRIAIGRGTLPPTLRYTISLQGSPKNLHTYSINVTLPDGSVTAAAYTSDANATDGEIATNLVAALNAVAGNNFIAAGTASPFTVTADAAGGWFALELTSLDDLSCEMNHADPGVATDLAAIALASGDWYALHTLYNSDAYVKAAAAWVSANKRLYVCDHPGSQDATSTSNGTNGTSDDLKALGYSRVAAGYHPRPAEMAAAAWYGSRLPLDPGSETWAYAPGVGVSANVLTATRRVNLDARNAWYYKEEAGLSFFWQGKVANGSYIDVTRGLDAFEDDLAKSIFNVLVSASARGEKIPYTDPGVAVIASEVRGALRRWVQRGLFAEDPAPLVAVPRVADISSTDKANRLLPDIKFAATLAGAIHSIQIFGVVSL